MRGGAAHGLNANIVRVSCMGRGIKLAGIAIPVSVPARAAGALRAPMLAADVRFVPIEMSFAERLRQFDVGVT